MTRQTFDSILDDQGREGLWEELERVGIGQKAINDMTLPEIEGLFNAAGVSEYSTHPRKIAWLIPTGQWQCCVYWKHIRYRANAATPLQAIQDMAISLNLSRDHLTPPPTDLT